MMDGVRAVVGWVEKQMFMLKNKDVRKENHFENKKHCKCFPSDLDKKVTKV